MSHGPVPAGYRLKYVNLRDKNKLQTINSGPLGDTKVTQTGFKITPTKETRKE
jgi:hypothetical protein